MSPDSVCAPGDTLESQYTIVRHLGVGRFGVSVRATDLKRNMDVVLKFIHTAYLPTPPHYKRFVDGMSLLRGTANPVMAGLLDVGMLNRRVYIATELLNGGSLAELLANRHQTGQPFTLGETYPILVEVASALIECPTMFHGAICPENIYIESGRIRVTESGLAANLPEAVVMRRLSSTGDKNRYVAPEIQSATGIGARSDVYSICVILGEMLTLQPFRNDPGEMTRLVAQHEPDIADIMSKALAENPRERFRDAETLLTALSDLAGLPAPCFNRSWADGELAASNGTGTQEDKTAQIVMKDVIQQHFDEITSVRRNPLLESPAEPAASALPAPPKPTASTAFDHKSGMGTSRPSFPNLQRTSGKSEVPTSASAPNAVSDLSSDNGLFSAGPPVSAPSSATPPASGIGAKGLERISVSAPKTATPLIPLDDTDTFDALEDITDEFEALQEEILEEVSAPSDFLPHRAEFRNDRSVDDEEKTINDKGILSMHPGTPADESSAAHKSVTEPTPKPEHSSTGIDPRFLRAAEKLDTARQNPRDTDDFDRLDGINPRFLRAAKALKESKIPDRPFGLDDDAESTDEDEDWRTRIEQEVGAASESMVSFMPTGQTALKKLPVLLDDASGPDDNRVKSPPPAIPASSDSVAPTSTSAPPPPHASPKSAAPPPPPRVVTKPAMGGLPSTPIPPRPSGVSSPPVVGIRSAAPPPPPPPVRKP
ncbi:MAG: protein kinase [Deltaproteobacteria bacterium]|nr:protein kinase [Deltaproteobacteria bacterium]